MIVYEGLGVQMPWDWPFKVFLRNFPFVKYFAFFQIPTIQHNNEFLHFAKKKSFLLFLFFHSLQKAPSPS